MSALTGIRVVDFSRLLPGPHLTQLLADFGADVVKVEDPGGGDLVRMLPPFVGTTSAAFAAVNQGKRSIAIDLKRPEGLALARALIARADVLVESFRPGVLARLGLDPADLRRAHPRLVICSISGYGQDGPLALRAGHDLDYLARAGLLALFGERGRTPLPPAVQIADFAGGALHGAIGILAALFERERTGEGRHLDIAMARSVQSLVAVEMARRAAGANEARGEGALTGGLPCYRVYETRDGREMALAALEPKFFAAFCARAGCPDLASDGLATGERGAEVRGRLEAVFRAHTQAEWVALLAGSESCCEPVLTPEEALARRDELGTPVQESATLPRVVADVGFGMPGVGGTVPALGADARSVVQDWDIDAALFEAARASGAMLVAE